MPFSVISASENLPAYLAGMVASSGERDFSARTVVLPTLRLGRHFLDQLEKKIGPCHPPRVMTLDRLIASFRRPRGRPVSPARRLFLLRALLDREDYPHLGAGMEGLIAGFYDELAGAGLSPRREETFSRLEEAVGDNPFGSEKFAAYWRTLSRELRELAGVYIRELERMGRQEFIWADLADGVRMEDEPGEGMILAGFYDASRIQEDFLRRLSVRAHFVYQAEDSPAFRPVIQFARRLNHDIRFALPRGVPPLLASVDGLEIRRLPGEIIDRIGIYSLSSLTAEAKQAKFECLKALTAGRSVLVVIPHRPEYVNVFSAVFHSPLNRQGEKLRFNTSLARTSFADPAVQLLLSLLDLAAGGFSSYDLGNFLLTPGASLLIAEDEETAAGIEHRLRQFLAGEFLEGFSEVISFIRFRLERWGKKEQGEIDCLTSLADILTPFDDNLKMRIGRWAVQVDRIFLRCCRLFPAGDLETVIRSRIRGVLAEMRDLDAHLSIEETPNDFLAIFRKYILAADVSTTPQPLEGVQLVHILEARSIPADLVVICGMNEGEFPASLPPRLLEDPYIRGELGLISSEHLEDLEELNFFSLLGQAERVVLTRSPRAIREEEAESRFITRLKLAGVGEMTPTAAGSRGDNTLRLFREGKSSARTALLEKELAGRSPDGFFPSLPDRIISLGAYRAAVFLNCPARFYLESAGIEPGLEVLERPDPRYEGSILHRVAAALWERIVGEGGRWDPERLAAALEELGGEMIPESPGYAYLRLMMSAGGWKRFSRSIHSFLEKFSPSRWEVVLKERFAYRGQVFALSGRADLIGRGKGGEEVVVDLKRSSFPGKKSIESLFEPQLPFYSLCRQLSGPPPARLAYCSFLKKARGYQELTEDGLGKELEKRLGERASEIRRRGGYASRPDELTCRYCPYAGICRAEESAV